ncbi:hypothetical protein AAC387_Pa08g2321 [Persea americana]|eukprot:TRINITY_DN6545_c0_g1_i7.p1 TRINITY_DN6545_c0_g1~~TRINITY_DN6545_c0_g1_i7.p1  ORF type:complete len:104 (-),score=24.23 TRINITY_DN6545_c0_g1_i7:479-790(-)
MVFTRAVASSLSAVETLTSRRTAFKWGTASFDLSISALTPDDFSDKAQFENHVERLCKSGNLNLGDALQLFDRMLVMEPRPSGKLLPQCIDNVAALVTLNMET